MNAINKAREIRIVAVDAANAVYRKVVRESVYKLSVNRVKINGERLPVILIKDTIDNKEYLVADKDLWALLKDARIQRGSLYSAGLHIYNPVDTHRYLQTKQR